MGTVFLAVSGSSKNDFESENMASISSSGMPWSTMAKNPIFSAALQSCSVIVSMRLSKSSSEIYANKELG